MYRAANERLRRWGGQIAPALATLPSGYASTVYAIVEDAIGETFLYALGNKDHTAYVRDTKRLADRYLRERPGGVDLSATAHAVQTAGMDDYGTCLVGRETLQAAFAAASMRNGSSSSSSSSQAASTSGSSGGSSPSSKKVGLIDTVFDLGDSLATYVVFILPIVLGFSGMLWEGVSPDGGPMADFFGACVVGIIAGVLLGGEAASMICTSRRTRIGKHSIGAIALGAICGFGGIVYVGFQAIDGTIAWRDSIPIVASIIAIGFIVCALVTAFTATSN